MADVTARMLALLSTLQTGRSFSGAELAQRLGVSPRTLRRDVDRLRGYGYPVDTRPGPGGYYRLATGRAMPPLVLDDDEAVATLLGLAVLAATGSASAGGLDEAATRAYGKLDQFLPARLRPRVASVRASVETSPHGAPPVVADQLGLIAEAIAHHEIVTFAYVDAHGEPTHRRVEPYRQLHHLLRWYLLAWDTDRADWRTFRLDRLSGAVRTGARYAPRPLPAGSALDLLRRGLHEARQRVDLVLDAPGPRVIDAFRYQDAEIGPFDDRRTRISLWIDSWQWLILHLAALDADFTFEAPPEVGRACRAFARRLLAATADATGSRPPQDAGGDGDPRPHGDSR